MQTIEILSLPLRVSLSVVEAHIINPFRWCITGDVDGLVTWQSKGDSAIKENSSIDC